VRDELREQRESNGEGQHMDASKWEGRGEQQQVTSEPPALSSEDSPSVLTTTADLPANGDTSLAVNDQAAREEQEEEGEEAKQEQGSGALAN